MKTKGFTLVELLVVIAILAILATVSVVGYTTYIKNANESLALQEMTQVKSSIMAEDIVNNDFSIASNGTVTNVKKTDADTTDYFNTYLNTLEANLNGTLEYANGKVTYTSKKADGPTAVLNLADGSVTVTTP